MAVSAMRVANLPDLLPRDRPKGAGGFRRGGAEEKKDDPNRKDAKKDDAEKEPLAVAPRVVKP